MRANIVGALCLCLLMSSCGGEQEQSSIQAPGSETQSIHTTTANNSTGSPEAAEDEVWGKSAVLNHADVEQDQDDDHTEMAPTVESPVAIAAPAAPVYRFFNNQTGAHLLTRSVTERDTILNTLPQFRYEGPVFAAWQATATGLGPVYRFANTRTGTHVFTISDTERNHILATMPWMKLEGTAYFAAKTALTGTTALYRFYHLQRGFHFYTASQSERDHLVANLPSTYRYEGVAYYVNANVGNFNRALASFVGKANEPGIRSGYGEDARFLELRDLAFDAKGNLYAVDGRFGEGAMVRSNIKKISPAGYSIDFVGNINRYGSKDGVGTDATFKILKAIDFDPSGVAYVADESTIRKITPTAAVSTIAGNLSETGYVNGQAQSARFRRIQGLAIDSNGNIFVSDGENHAIRKITPTGVVSTFAGPSTWNPGFADGTGSAAQFYYPGQIAIDSNDNLYVADQYNNRIRKITPAGVVTTLAGQDASGVVDGEGVAARFDRPYAIAVDKATGNIYAADWEGYTIRKITPTGTVTTVVGTPYNRGVFFGALPAGLAEVGGLAIRNGRLYVSSLNGIYWTNL